MAGSWLVLLPPLIVLATALITRNVMISLLLGILTGTALVEQGAPGATLLGCIDRIKNELSDLDHLYTFGFLLSLGILIELLTHSGGIKAYSRAVKKFIKDRRSTETLSLIVSSTFFIDDYLNSLTTGAIMRPLTDSERIPRAKLAFLLDSLSAPLSVLIPASSWIAMILVQLQVSGVSLLTTDKPLFLADPLTVYLKSIPFLCYPILIVLSAWFITRKQLSFGLMKSFEQEAQVTGNLFGGKKPLHTSQLAQDSQGSLLNFVLPIGWFLCALFAMVLYTGGFMTTTSSILQAILQAHIFSSLCAAGLSTLIVSSLFFIATKALKGSHLLLASRDGMLLMKNSFIVLSLAWTLSTLLKNDLQTGAYLAHLLLSSLSVALIPLIFFLVATITSASIGSAWGTIAIITPLALPLVATITGMPTPLALEMAPLLAPTIGALISGAVAGGHFSPITDSAVMASTSAGCYHLDHVQTQISYALPALLGSALAFLLIGVLHLYVPLATAQALGILLGSLTTVGLLLARAMIHR